MPKMYTPLKKTELYTLKKQLEENERFEPKAATVSKILQFAAAYKADKVSDNQYIEWFLN